MNEMGLIVIAAIECNLCPINLPCAVNRGKGLLKTAHSTEGLWRKSYLLAKQLDKAPGAEPDLPGHPCNGRRVWQAAKMVQRIVYCRMPRQRTRKLIEQVLLKDLKQGSLIRRGQHALAELAYAQAPKVFKRDRSIFHGIGRLAEERK